MSKASDLTGQSFGRLTAIERAGSQNGNALWRCKCGCGNIVITTANRLKKGEAKSCGCLRRELSRNRLLTHGGEGTRLYRIWTGMKERCMNPKRSQFHRYGGRGITVCEEWLHDFSTFQAWAFASGYRDDLTIDRIDNDKGYSPENCRWATMKEQSNNRHRRTKSEVYSSNWPPRIKEDGT